jgi:Right handed beta helix region
MNSTMRGRLGFYVILGILELSGQTSVDAATKSSLYVTNDGSDSGGCGAQSNPCRSIDQAIQNAAAGDTILVGAGQYGDLNGDGQLSGPGEERGSIPGCVVCINKSLTILSLHGANVTIIDAAKLPVSINTVVEIGASNVTFGSMNAGFTVAGARVTGVSAASPAQNVHVRGNIALNNGQSGFDFFQVHSLDVSDNSAFGNGSGIFVSGPNDGSVSTVMHNITAGNSGFGIAVNGNGIQIVSNVTTHNAGGISAQGNGLIINGNTASNNTEFGLFVLGLLQNASESVTSFRGNTMAGNLGPGMILILPVQVFTENNFYGNDTNTTRVTGEPGARCGVLNTSGATVRATNNFWGRLGPNQLAAGDFVGGVCDQRGMTLFQPFVKAGFAITN